MCEQLLCDPCTSLLTSGNERPHLHEQGGPQDTSNRDLTGNPILGLRFEDSKQRCCRVADQHYFATIGSLSGTNGPSTKHRSAAGVLQEPVVQISAARDSIAWRPGRVLPTLSAGNARLDLAPSHYQGCCALSPLQATEQGKRKPQQLPQSAQGRIFPRFALAP